MPTGSVHVDAMKVSALTPEQDEQLQAWRALALEEMPYFAHILYQVRPLNAPGLGTWAVDEHWRLYVDFETVTRTKTFRWNVESVLHEVSHLYADDATSAKEIGITTEQRQVWNAAADLALNDDLDQAGCTTFRSDKMLPEFIGEPNGETPHHYLAVLQSKMAQVQAPNQAPRLGLRPSTLPAGNTAGVRVHATVTPAILDPKNYTLSVVDGDGNDVGIRGVRTLGSGGLSFEIVGDVPAGSAAVSVTTGSHALTATLAVEEPSIRLAPNHVASGWEPPMPIVVQGRWTQFDPNTTVTLESPDGTPVAVTGVETTSSTEVTFKIAEQVADGLYTVIVADQGQHLHAPLPIGLPHLTLVPQTLPVGFAAPQPVGVTPSDFPLDSTTTFTLSGVPMPADVRSSSYAELGVPELPLGEYVVTATTGQVQASAILQVADSDDSDGGGEGSAGDGEGDTEGPFKGCGSGSGGEAWEGELPEADDLDGAATSISTVDKEVALLATAAAIRDYVAKGRGTVPGGLVAIADKILEPSTTPWERVLASAIRASVNSKRGPLLIDHRRPNRRRSAEVMMTPSGPKRVFYPGRSNPQPSIEFIRDTSGSMGAVDLAVVTREVERVAKRIGIRGDSLVVTDVDAAVHTSTGYKNRGSLRSVTGRGGTDMSIGIEHAWARKKNRPSTIVVATDGGTPWPREPGPIPVVAAIIPPYGIEDEDYVQAYLDEALGLIPDWIRVVVCDPGKVAGTASTARGKPGR